MLGTTVSAAGGVGGGGVGGGAGGAGGSGRIASERTSLAPEP
jgi:hypothetical protein